MHSSMGQAPVRSQRSNAARPPTANAPRQALHSKVASLTELGDGLVFFRRLVVLPPAILTIMFIAGCTSLPRTSYTASDGASSTVLDLDKLRRYRKSATRQ